MKKSYIIILGFIVILMMAGLIIASVKSSQKYFFSNSAESTHKTLVAAGQFISPDDAAKMLAANDRAVMFIDIRNPREFDNFHLDNAQNVPTPQVLDLEYKYIWDSETQKILYGEDSRQADQVRTLLIQFGYSNISVLHGGVNYWKHNMIDAGPFSSSANFEDEKLNTEALKAALGK